MQEYRAQKRALGCCYRCDKPSLPGGLLCSAHREDVTRKEVRALQAAVLRDLRGMLLKHGVPREEVNGVLLNPPVYGNQVAEALCHYGLGHGNGRLLWKFLRSAPKDSRSFEFKLIFNQIASLIGLPPKSISANKVATYKPPPASKHKTPSETPPTTAVKPMLRSLQAKAEVILRDENPTPEIREIIQQFLVNPDLDLRSKAGVELKKILSIPLGLTPSKKSGPKPKLQLGAVKEFILSHPDLPATALVELGAQHELEFVKNTVYWARGRNGINSRLQDKGK